MKLKNILAFTCMVLLSCSSARQVIESAEAFTISTQPGVIAVDEKGNELTPASNTVLVMYIQTKSPEMKWDTIWMNEKPYPVTSQSEIVKPFEAGFDNISGEKMIMQPQPGFHLFQLQAEPGIRKGEEWPASVRVRAWYKNKPVFKEIKTIKTLRPFDAQ
jgi:hypothetical protein